jgi:hypothetical protein
MIKANIKLNFLGKAVLFFYPFFIIFIISFLINNELFKNWAIGLILGYIAFLALCIVFFVIKAIILSFYRSLKFIFSVKIIIFVKTVVSAFHKNLKAVIGIKVIKVRIESGKLTVNFSNLP